MDPVCLQHLTDFPSTNAAVPPQKGHSFRHTAINIVLLLLVTFMFPVHCPSFEVLWEKVAVNLDNLFDDKDCEKKTFSSSVKIISANRHPWFSTPNHFPSGQHSVGLP